MARPSHNIVRDKKKSQQVNKVNASLAMEGKNTSVYLQKIMSAGRRRDKCHYSHLE